MAQILHCPFVWPLHHKNITSVIEKVQYHMIICTNDQLRILALHLMQLFSPALPQQHYLLLLMVQLSPSGHAKFSLALLSGFSLC